MTREDQTIDDMAATLLDIIHLAPIEDLDQQRQAIRLAAFEAIDRWKAGKPWPRLNNPNPPPKPNDDPSF